MKLSVTLTRELVPMPAEQRPAWEAALDAIAELIVEARVVNQEDAEKEDGPINERSHAAAG